jgi:hypothetical protein
MLDEVNGGFEVSVTLAEANPPGFSSGGNETVVEVIENVVGIGPAVTAKPSDTMGSLSDRVSELIGPK